MERNIYKEKGYKNRNEYLNEVAEEYGNADAVYAIADVLGDGEDFDGLLAMLDDFEYLGML